MPRQLTLMEAQAAGHITHIRGNDSNVGMTIEVQNDSDEAITITSEPGTVIGSRDPDTQKMVIIREGSWTVPPRSRGSIALDALCMEAHKAPPSSKAGEVNHSIGGTTDNADVKKLINTVREVEAEISDNITATDTEARTFSHTLESPNLITLAAAASHTNVEGQNAFHSQIYDAVVQMPVWEVTDELGITEYAQVVGMDKKSETHEELRATVETLSAVAKVAGILLSEADLSDKQTILPAEDELEILVVERGLLSSAIDRLLRDAATPGPDRESARIKLKERKALLKEKDREIEVYPNKETLIGELLRLSITDDLAGRTTLLGGIRADSLQRDGGIQRHDLDLIITQLARLGRDEHGNVLLVRLIDNALPYAKGSEVHTNLTNLRDEFTTLGEEE